MIINKERVTQNGEHGGQVDDTEIRESLECAKEDLISNNLNGNLTLDSPDFVFSAVSVFPTWSKSMRFVSGVTFQ